MNKKMLLLDRGHDILNLAHEIMFYGYSDMHITSDPSDVYKIAKTYKPDLILLDYVLANDSADEIYQFIKQSDDLKHIPVIVVAANYNKVINNDEGESVYIKSMDNQDFANKIGYLMAS
ncbi:hypothetical protein [Mucilaginibacter sp. KACC 22063]|uniref:hypothetical protein n=1 Tax=Mucilaginibacter sp. KACC 22063 TaxID=3025666 RepID=UPI002366CB90|nr:hypothetical protein [Mucilaginibacter sp. KACC 22063]WDF54668.1 hypothetical protein PQ461_17190 [Mucilaginibacter sp. KACC 22063]